MVAAIFIAWLFFLPSIAEKNMGDEGGDGSSWSSLIEDAAGIISTAKEQKNIFKKDIMSQAEREENNISISEDDLAELKSKLEDLSQDQDNNLDNQTDK